MFGPDSSRQDYDSGPSVSTGKIHAFYIRDKFELSDRLSVEAGLRAENQTGSSDIGQTTVDTTVLAPRLSGSYALTGDGKTLLTASYGRYHAGIIQDFSDAFAQVAQQANYDNFIWNGSDFVFSNRVEVSGDAFTPNLDLKPSHVDESTVGFQRQFGASMGVGARFIYRKWGNLIDDVISINPDETLDRQVLNYDAAEREYKGVQFTLEKRFANNWNAAASYTYSETRGNHFGDAFTTLGDYIGEMCRTAADPTVGEGGIIPCLEVQNGANKYGAPTYDRPHNFKLAGAYVRPVGPVNLTFGAVTELLSKFRYQKERTVNVLLPGHPRQPGGDRDLLLQRAGLRPGRRHGVVHGHVGRGDLEDPRHRTTPASRRRSSTSPTGRRSCARTTWCGAARRRAPPARPRSTTSARRPPGRLTAAASPVRHRAPSGSRRSTASSPPIGGPSYDERLRAMPQPLVFSY